MIAASDQLKHYLHDRYEGRDMGISAVGTFGYLFAFTIVLYLLISISYILTFWLHTKVRSVTAVMMH